MANEKMKQRGRSRLKEFLEVYVVPLLPGSMGLEYFRYGKSKCEIMRNNREIEEIRKSRRQFKKLNDLLNSVASSLFFIFGSWLEYSTYLPLTNAIFEASRDEGNPLVAAAYVGLSAVIRYPLYKILRTGNNNIIGGLENSRERLDRFRKIYKEE